MRKVFYTLLFLVVIYSCGTKNSIDKDKEHIDSICDNVMQNFKDGKVSIAMELIKSNSLIAPSTIDTLEKTILQQMKSGALSSYGEVHSYEFVGERKIKDFFAKRFYALKYKSYFLKFSFGLYKSGFGWKITGFKYDDDITELY